MPQYIDFLEIGADTLAQQMTLFTAQLFNNISASELEIWPRTSQQNTMPEQTPHINALIQHHSSIYRWTVRALTEPADAEKKLHALYHLITIAEACLALSNFATLVSIISAVSSAQAQQVTEKINETARAKLTQLQTLISPAKGFMEFRQAIRVAKLPCVPFLGFALTDLKFIEEGMPDVRKDGTRNEAKVLKRKEVIIEILRFQSESFRIVERMDVQRLLFDSLGSSLEET